MQDMLLISLLIYHFKYQINFFELRKIQISLYKQTDKNNLWVRNNLTFQRTVIKSYIKQLDQDEVKWYIWAVSSAKCLLLLERQKEWDLAILYT